MRVESTKGSNEWKVWLTPEQKDTLVEAAESRSHRHKVVILLGAEVGLRAAEMTVIRPCDVFKEEGKYRLTVLGKDTTGAHGEAGKRRDAYLPDSVERELLELQYSEDIDDREPYFSVTADRIRQIVHEAAGEVIELDAFPGRGPDWEKVSSHDLRRHFAQTCLVRKRKNPRVVMAIGGWDSFESIKPYLNSPTADVINEEMDGLFN